MTVVEVFICGEKIVSPDNRLSIPPAVTSLLIEGIAQNTTGSVLIPEVGERNKHIFFVRVAYSGLGCIFFSDSRNFDGRTIEMHCSRLAKYSSIDAC